MHRVLYILLLFVVFPVSAQNRFITLNWQELPAAQTLPEVVESIPLPDDFRFYTYHVKIEFPEFVDLDPEAAAELTRKKVNLPDYPQAETSVGVAAYEGILSVRFVPVVHRGGVYQRINSFKLSVISTPVPVAARANYTVAKTTEKSVLSSGRFVKIRVSDSGVYRITSAELRGMGFPILIKCGFMDMEVTCYRIVSPSIRRMIFRKCLYTVVETGCFFMPVGLCTGRRTVIRSGA